LIHDRGGVQRSIWPFQPGELGRVREAEGALVPFLLYRDDYGVLHLHHLAAETERVVIGRRATSDLVVGWDERVSRAHAELEQVGAEWTVQDDGLSKNGTFLNEERVSGRRRMRDGDLLRVGNTVLVFRSPTPGSSQPTMAPDGAMPVHVSPTQRRVLASLCHRYAAGESFATPATNEEIAADLHLSVDAVKGHLRMLFQRFGIGDLPQNQKRARLAHLAMTSGLVNQRDP
jgi:DNA-binding CsgD family transcriptional regulator